MDIFDNDMFRGCLFATVGFIVLLMLLLRRFQRARYKGGASAIVTHECRRGKDRYVYQPVYEYTVEGTSYQVASRWGHRLRIAKDGTEITLSYIPGRPEKIYVPLESRTFLVFKVFLSMFGAVSFIMGLGIAMGLIDG